MAIAYSNVVETEVFAGYGMAPVGTLNASWDEGADL